MTKAAGYRCELCRHLERRCRECRTERTFARRAVRAQKLLAGVCVDCHTPAAPGRTRCAHHLEQHAAWARRSRLYEPESSS